MCNDKRFPFCDAEKGKRNSLVSLSRSSSSCLFLCTTFNIWCLRSNEHFNYALSWRNNIKLNYPHLRVAYGKFESSSGLGNLQGKNPYISIKMQNPFKPLLLIDAVKLATVHVPDEEFREFIFTLIHTNNLQRSIKLIRIVTTANRMQIGGRKLGNSTLYALLCIFHNTFVYVWSILI